MTRATPRAADAIRFDPGAVLLREPGILLDPHFLGSLHAELEEQEGADDAEITLFQMGFLHGLKDAMQAVNNAFGSDEWDTRSLAGPLLAFRLYAEAPAAATAALSFQGVWPERTEASARLAALGRPLHPSCFLTAGYTSGWLSGTLDADMLALETACSACGAVTCTFSAREASVWRELGEPDSLRFLDTLPFTAFRTFVQSQSAAQNKAPAPSDRFDRNASIVPPMGFNRISPRYLGGNSETV